MSKHIIEEQIVAIENHIADLAISQEMLYNMGDLDRANDIQSEIDQLYVELDRIWTEAGNMPLFC